MTPDHQRPGALQPGQTVAEYTGGSTGTWRPIRERWPDVVRAVVEPADSAVISGR